MPEKNEATEFLNYGTIDVEEGDLLFFPTFLVITEPAPTILFLSMVTGATKEEFDPINTLSLIFVLLFFIPS